jgi:hypothetical protein
VKIDNSNILLGSQRSYSETNEEHTELSFWINPKQNNSTDTVNISEKARSQNDADGISSQDDALEPEINGEVSLKKLIAELLSGYKIKNVRIDKAEHASDAVPVEKKDQTQSTENGSVGWGLNFKDEKIHRESENVGFTAQGIIKTSDGKEINFTLQLEMKRETVESDTVSVRAGDALKDPLVLNFNGNAAQLENKSFSFDINADGTNEQLPGLAQGSGYLAIDSNNDGIINNGSELFGPQSGDGFKELAQYDEDGNHWIDENDTVFKKLYVMSADEKGNQSLHSLQGLGVGAIYLPNRSTLFDLKDQSSSELLGRVTASGIFINDDGTAGTIQQIDLKA